MTTEWQVFAEQLVIFHIFRGSFKTVMFTLSYLRVATSYQKTFFERRFEKFIRNGAFG